MHSLVLWALVAWRIPAYEIHIQVRPDLSLQVHERYTVDFRQDPHRGIYRQIPAVYRRGLLFQNARIHVHQVLRNGQAEPYVVRLKGRDLFLRIGDPHRWLRDLEVYDIVYTVRYGLDLRGDSAYLYFNAIGPQWSVPLEQGRVVVHLPLDTPHGPAHAWLGRPGSRDHRLLAQEPQPGVLVFEPQEAVLPGRALTVFVPMPRQFFVAPDALEQGLHLLVDNAFYLIPLLVLALLLWIWYRWGRDPAVRRSVVVRYDPPEDLTPGEAGVLLDERLNPRDLAATVLDLARRGYLTVRDEPRKVLFFTLHRYAFRLDNPDLSGLKPHEQELLRLMFPAPRQSGQWVQDQQVKEHLREGFQRLKRAFYKTVVQARYFPTSPETVRGIVLAIGILWMVGVIFLAVIHRLPLLYLPGLMASGLLILLFSPIMPRKTPRGVRKYLEIKGFEEFLRRVEQDQIRRLGREVDTYFAQLLPYAVVFGVEDRLLEAFDGLLNASPSWYLGASGHPMDLHTFGHSLSSTLGQFNSLFTSATRGGGGLSGGGSAGGGIGGGGGGAW